MAKTYSSPTIAVSVNDPMSTEVVVIIDKRAERRFIRNVFIILIGLTILTIAVASLILTVEFLKKLLGDTGVSISALVISWAFYTALICCYGVSRSTPMNYIMLICLSISVGVLTAFLTEKYLKWDELTMFLITMGILIVTCIILAALGCTMPFDITPLMALLFVLMLALVTLFIIWVGMKDETLWKVFIVLGVIVMSLHFLVDVHIVAQKREKYFLTSSDHVLAATLLYVDVFCFFAFLNVVINDIALQKTIK